MNSNIKISVTTALAAIAAGGTLYAQNETSRPYQGKIGRTIKESQAWWPEAKKAPANAPNVVWILIDDAGFGSSSTFGGLVQTPTLDSLANNGIRYTNFHTTAICSPTRAALLTGRNHHSAHMGLFPETAVGFPGYDARIPFEKATVAEILKENGYNTFAVGKWHLTPVNEVTQAGPFNRWPTGRGFEHYYGFLYGETDQWHPELWEDTKKIDIEPNKKHLNELLSDKAINYIANQKSVDPEKPFFLYLATGATHAPHHVAKEWIDKYKGKFDDGWDAYREKVLANQKKLGVVPQNVVLPERNPGIKAWKDLSPEEKKLYARFMEVYAGFFSYTDYEIGRVINYIKKIGQLDNTLVFVVVGDNGASKEGTETGTTNGLGALFLGKDNIENLLKQYDKIGSEYSSPNYPLGWAMAANTPFRYWKQDANSEGGTRNPLIAFWPKGFKEKGTIRTQYGHVIDLLPTTIELTGTKVPEVINGYKQEPIEGTSLANSLTDPKAISKHTVQYYEIMGSRAIYKDGWKASVLHKKLTLTGQGDFSKDVWELYNLNEDFNELNDLAAQKPDKLKELQDLFDSEAWKYNVYPLKDGLEGDFIGDKGPFAGRKQIVLYPGISQLFTQSAPDLRSKSYSLTADVTIPASGAEGVLLADGGRFGGISFYVQNRKLYFVHTNGGNKTIVESSKPVPAGKVKLRFDYIQNAPKYATNATGTLYINDEKVGENTFKLYYGILYFAYDEGFDVGRDSNTEVSDSYKVPFTFNGELEKITIDFK
jgi:arylsulfatase A-like enzyme